jgi:hypothetical protein
MTYCKILYHNKLVERIIADMKRIDTEWQLRGVAAFSTETLNELNKAFVWDPSDPPMFPVLETAEIPSRIRMTSDFKRSMDALGAYMPFETEWPRIPITNNDLADLEFSCLAETMGGREKTTEEIANKAEIRKVVEFYIRTKAIQYGSRLHDLKKKFYTNFCLRVHPAFEFSKSIDEIMAECIEKLEPVIVVVDGN